MLLDLVRALPAAVAAAVLPGYFWASLLRPSRGLGERLAYATAISMALVPVVAVALARAAGTGVELWVAVAAALAVFAGGALAHARWGAAAGPTRPLLPEPPAVRDPRLLALLAADGVALLAIGVDEQLPGWLKLLLGAGMAAAGVLAAWPAAARGGAIRAATGHATGDARPADPGADADSGPGGTVRGPGWLAHPRAGDIGLGAVLALTGLIVYAGAARFDWPMLRGSDQFSHAVMAEQMMVHGQYSSYLVYPPGFATLTAVICRFSGLTPLALFPVLAPSLLMLAPLAAYALASRLWGWRYGVGAAALAGLVLSGPYNSYADGRYPDLITANFLLVMAVAALVSLYGAPTISSAALLVPLGASVMFYHSVATLYLVVLLALVAVVGLPYLALRHRRGDARALALALAATAVLAGCYAAYVYDLPALLGGHSATSSAVGAALGSQPPDGLFSVIGEISPAIAFLGLLGAAALAAGIRWLRHPAQRLTALTMAGWCAFMFLGSRAGIDGFPQRFERDIGAPLAVTAAFAAGLIVRSLASQRARRAEGATAQGSAGARPPAARPAPGVPRLGLAVLAGTVLAAVAAGATLLTLADQGERNLITANSPTRWMLTPKARAAGRWLAAHNTGGNLISTPYFGPGMTGRAMLAMGWYTGLQSYAPKRIAHPRSLPTAGRQPLLDSQEVLLHPQSCQSGRIVASDDIRYVVLYKTGPQSRLGFFATDPVRYRVVFQNQAVIIYRAIPRGGKGECG